MIEPISRERLRAADPAATARSEPERIDALLERILAEPSARPATRRRPRRRLVLIPVLAAAVTIAALVLAAGGDRRDGPARILPGLTERAYAATAAGDAILHEVVRSEQSTDDGGAPSTILIEMWSRPSDGSVLERIRDVGEPANGGETLLDANGRLLVRSPGRGPWTDLTASDGRPGRLYRSEVRRLRGESTAAAYRKAFEASTLTPAGTTTFAGREAESFTAAPRASQDDETTWFIEKRTARVLGSTTRQSTTIIGKQVDITNTVILERYERLPPTTKHLDLLQVRAGEDVVPQPHGG